MPMNFGNNVSKYVSNGTAKVGAAAWVRMVASGTLPLAKRQWIEVQLRGQGALAFTTTNMNADGTFTAPTYSAAGAKIFPSGSVYTLPLADTVMLWGRFCRKITTAGGMKVVISEYS